ncbi:hypothetical protein PIROE2DRAFT_4874 [Piromyces sp. E2]|nr:hypothetical protein PIROE2DRAFT_4874 [Piromyces sp. E2]|eukprot:OUM67590.1 hypothetical protein PIROE2DRAFT_4874 [Piromyces sp. E2]
MITSLINNIEKLIPNDICEKSGNNIDYESPLIEDESNTPTKINSEGNNSVNNDDGKNGVDYNNIKGSNHFIEDDGVVGNTENENEDNYNRVGRLGYKKKRDTNYNSQKIRELKEILDIIDSSGKTYNEYNYSDIEKLVSDKRSLLECNGFGIFNMESTDNNNGNSKTENTENNKYLTYGLIAGGVAVAIVIIGALFILIKRKDNKKVKSREINGNEYYLPEEDITITSIKHDTSTQINTSFNGINQSSGYYSPLNMQSSPILNGEQPVISPSSPPLRPNTSLISQSSPLTDTINANQLRNINASEDNYVNRNLSLNSTNNYVNRNLSLNSPSVNNMSPPLIYSSNSISFNQSNQSLNNISVPVVPLNMNTANNVPSQNALMSSNSVLSNNSFVSNSVQLISSNSIKSNVQPVVGTVLPTSGNINNVEQPITGATLPTYVDSFAQKVQPNEHVFVAQYYYNPAFNDEFQISPGDVISFGQSTYDDGWAHGSNLTKETTGVFPLGVVIKIVDIEGKNRDPYQLSEKYRCKPRSSSHTVKYQASTSEKDPKFEKNSLELNFLLGKMNKNIEMKNNNENENDITNTTIIKEKEKINDNNEVGASGSSSTNQEAGASGSGSSSFNQEAGASGSGSGSSNQEAGASGSGSGSSNQEAGASGSGSGSSNQEAGASGSGSGGSSSNN